MKLITKRLLLNPFSIDDASVVAKLAGDKKIHDMTDELPYPYEQHMAVEWINTHDFNSCNHVFAIRLKEVNELMGCVNILQSYKHKRGMLGYWIGVNYWNKGYGTEAINEVIRYGFEELGLNKIWAESFEHNKASAKIMEKCGMKDEATLKKHYLYKGDKYIDIVRKCIFKD